MSVEEKSVPIDPHSMYDRRRSAARYKLRRADDAFLEFDSNDGSHCKSDLVEISASGVRFSLDQDPTVLVAGATVGLATISAGEVRIAGRLRVAHVTSGFASGTDCGAEFFPWTQEDQRSLSQLIAKLDERSVHSG